MGKTALALAVMGVMSMGLAACAGPDTGTIDWNRPFTPWTGPAPVFQRNLVIANPPYPHDHWVNYEEEPTRFVFHPRNLPPPDDTDNGTGAADEGGDYGYTDMGAEEGAGGGEVGGQ